jgi:hypothetical protein
MEEIATDIHKDFYSKRAKAKRIQQLRSLDLTLEKIASCYIKAKRWNRLSPTERIMLELEWTDSAIEILSIGNINVMHSLHYGLRELTPDENDIGGNY